MELGDLYLQMVGRDPVAAHAPIIVRGLGVEQLFRVWGRGVGSIGIGSIWIGSIGIGSMKKLQNMRFRINRIKLSSLFITEALDLLPLPHANYHIMPQ